MGDVFKIQAADFHRLVYNAKLYQVGSTAEDANFTVTPNGVSMLIEDHFTIMYDWAPAEGPFLPFRVSPAEVKALYKALDTLEGELVIHWEHKASGDPLCRIEGPGPQRISFAEPLVNQSVYRTFDESMDPDQIRDIYDNRGFGVNPDRFRKLSLIKPGDYPIDLKPVHHDKYGQLILFRAGPTARGVITTVDRETLKKEFDGDDYLW